MKVSNVSRFDDDGIISAQVITDIDLDAEPWPFKGKNNVKVDGSSWGRNGAIFRNYARDVGIVLKDAGLPESLSLVSVNVHGTHPQIQWSFTGIHPEIQWLHCVGL